MMLLRPSLVVSSMIYAAKTQQLGPGPSAFTVTGAFPTSLFSSYYNNPTQTVSQVQPIISDPVTHHIFPLHLTDPDTIPLADTVDPFPLPEAVSPNSLLNAAIKQIGLLLRPNTINSPFINDTCAACQSALGFIKMVSLAAPEEGPAAITALCNAVGMSNCSTTVGSLGSGNVITQVLANADTAGFDGQMICNNFIGTCPLPPTTPLNLTGWFAKPKPNPLPQRRKPSGKRLKVLHLSDFHLDPRYATGSEANCTSQGMCCRKNAFAASSPKVPLQPAPRFGTFSCDTPYSLAVSALLAIPILTGTEHTGLDFTLYTGDLTSHDPTNEAGREYLMYAETVIYDLIKRVTGSAPVYAALGNHDTFQSSQDAPHSLGGDLGTQFSWNYDHLSGLWQHEGWLPESAIDLARAHYGAYSVRRADGLRIITINTDFWLLENWFNYFNMTEVDISGTFRFLTDELQEAEDTGDRVWIVGHVLSGWDGTNTLMNPSNLFYQIVDRFSPHVIANIFFGHTHEDHFSIFYANNGTAMHRDNALAVSWIAPSLTPLTDLNSGFRMYEVDSNTFEVLDAYTWIANVSTFPDLDDQLEFGPTFKLEYSTRETYGANIHGWGPNDPLNATWWHLVTEVMENDPALVDTFNTFLSKSSVFTEPCRGECANATICYMRSGSASIANENCPPGFGF